MVTSALLAFGAVAFANDAIDIEADFAPGSHTRFVERVGVAQQSDYRAVLDAYDERRRAHPTDVSSQIERCRFIEPFAYSEDQTIESANDDLEACRESLASGPNASNIDVILYGVGYAWTDEQVEKAQGLLAESRDWTSAQRAALLEQLSGKFVWKDAELAANYAMRAVDLKPDSHVIFTAVERYIQLGAKEKARRLLVDAPPSTWEVASRITAAKLLVSLGDPEAAADILAGGADKSTFQDKLSLAGVLASTGEHAEARKLYQASLIESAYLSNDQYVEFLEFELAHGSREDAVAAYKLLRDRGYGADPLARQRLSLFANFPGAAWQARDGLGLLSLAAVVLILMLVPLAVVAPIHYRGVIRRLYFIAPEKPVATWSLRHVWYALASFLIAGAISLYLFAPTLLEWLLPWHALPPTAAPITDIALGRSLLCSTLLSILFLLPILRRRPVKSLLLGDWSLRKSIFVGLGLAIALKILAVLVGLGLKSVGGALGSDTIRSMQGIHTMFGLAGLLFTVSIAVPFLEELIFRGVMLEAFRGQVSFWFAALVQALAFVLIHESWADMPFLLAFALVAAWLAKRSRGLLAPMVMHGVNNGLAAMAIIGMTHALNR